MDIRLIHPEEFRNKPEDWFRSFLSSLLIRTNFMPAVSNRLGWRGLKACCKNGEGWTCRIQGSKGVYALKLAHAEYNTLYLNGKWHLYFFPDSDSELIDLIPPIAGRLAGDVNFKSAVREFLCYPDLSKLFRLCDIDFCLSMDFQSFVVSLLAFDCLQVGATAEVFEGFVDKKDYAGCSTSALPAANIAWPFMKVLCASIAFGLSESPSFIRKDIVSGLETDIQSLNGKQDYTVIGFGDVQMGLQFCDEFRSKSKSVKNRFLWTSSMPAGSQPFKDALFWKNDLGDPARFNPSLLDVAQPTNMIILSGYLGSGKTCFLNQLIEYHVQNNRFVAVIQNEIGKTGLDVHMLEDEYAVVEMDEGCVCCSLIGQLQKGIKQILAHHQPDLIVLETTGLANPFNLLAEISALSGLIKLVSIVTIADSKNLPQLLKRSELAKDQIRAADNILLNKIDLVDKNDLYDLKQSVQVLNPKAHIHCVENASMNPALLYSYDENYDSSNGDKILPTTGHHTHKEEKMDSICLSPAEIGSIDSLNQSFQKLPQGIYRVKGLLYSKDNSSWYIVQFVNGLWDIKKYSKEKEEKTFLTVIGDSESLKLIDHQFINL